MLLVEDHALNREVATDLLQSAGLVVESAENGRAALEKVRGAQFAVILMDMLMPEMDGLEATRAIRQLPEWQGVPIIAMTANAFEEDRQACRSGGHERLHRQAGFPAGAVFDPGQMAFDDWTRQ